MSAWLADRTRLFDSSGIRKIFDLGAKMKDPINLSIGQPDFEVPAPAREAAIGAIESRRNGYAVTQGIPTLRDGLQQRIDLEYGHSDRPVFISSGTSGALVLAIQALVNPGEEVILFDPYFVSYEPLVKFVGGTPVVIDTYPNFTIDLDRVRAAITPRTKAILFNSPANPNGIVASEAEVRGLAELAAEHNVVLISDEIYRLFCYDRPYISPAKFNEQTLVVDGFSKSYAMTGWRVGYAHGPTAIIETMLKLQQYTFVCAPQPAQWGAAAALDYDMGGHIDTYRKKRDFMVEQLSSDYEVVAPGGAFYIFPRAPRGTATEFVTRAIEQNVLMIPGGIFGKHDTNFRISYAVDDRTLQRGVEVLKKLSRS